MGICWEPSREEYREALKVLNSGKQHTLKTQMLELVKERVFYLNTLKYHTGMVQNAPIGYVHYSVTFSLLGVRNNLHV